MKFTCQVYIARNFTGALSLFTQCTTWLVKCVTKSISHQRQGIEINYSPAIFLLFCCFSFPIMFRVKANILIDMQNIVSQCLFMYSSWLESYQNNILEEEKCCYLPFGSWQRVLWDQYHMSLLVFWARMISTELVWIVVVTTTPVQTTESWSSTAWNFWAHIWPVVPLDAGSRPICLTYQPQVR
jgi:hypothetical protein